MFVAFVVLKIEGGVIMTPPRDLQDPDIARYE